MRENQTDVTDVAAAVALEHRIARITLLLMDCDGVLTDGRITPIGEHDETKSFHTRDGHGIVMLHRAGLRTGVISGNRSSSLERRAQNLKMAFVRQGEWDKLSAFRQLLVEADVDESQVAFIGDDVVDLPLLLRVGFAVATADAVAEVRQAAHYVTHTPGGFGAVREVCELILKAQNRWTELMRRYTEERTGE